MKILVTGAAGMIGRELCRRLVIMEDTEVIGLDLPEAITAAIELGQTPPIRYHGVDVADRGTIWETFHALQPDKVVHLAAMLGVQHTEQNPATCYDTNVTGSKNVFDAAGRHGAEHVLFASSSEVYGGYQVGGLQETSHLLGNNVYARSKIAGENLLMSGAMADGYDWTIFRLFNTYGPGQVAQFAIPKWVNELREDKQPTVYGTGLAMRSFCYVDDTVTGILKALMLPAARNEIFNIGSSEPIRIIDAANTVIRASRKSLFEPRLVPMSQADRRQSREVLLRWGTIDKAKNLLGFCPEVSLLQGAINMFNGSPCPSRWAWQTSAKVWA